MHLNRLSLINFKNHLQADFEFIDTINCFTGNNGVGKTNFLDAIYFLSFSKSFFNGVDSHAVNFDQEFLMLQGEYVFDTHTDKIHIGIKKGKKKTVKRNDKPYKKLAEHIGEYPLVMVSPADTNLVTEGSEIRRKFLDGVISQFNPIYLDQLLKYNKAVQQRNALLKTFVERGYFDAETLNIWNDQLALYGQPVYEARKAFLAEFTPVFQKYYDLISGAHETVSLAYQTQLEHNDFDSLFKEYLHAERAAQHSKVGIHKDDLEFLINGHSVKKYGSQGQQKTYLLALKLAQFDVIKQHKGIKPILLLDDIFDKLDSHRIQALMTLVSEENFGQIFVSDTNADRILRLFENIHLTPKIFEVAQNK